MTKKIIKLNFPKINSNSRIVATYETALMRSYYNGRTETVRSVQCETVDWVTSFLNESENVNQTKKMMKVWQK